MNALPIAVAFVGAMGAFGFWTFFLARDSIRRAAPHSPPLRVEPERSRAAVVVPASKFQRVDEPRASAPRARTRIAVAVIAALIFVSVLAGGPRPPTRAS
jgi:hypothetical protein